MLGPIFRLLFYLRGGSFWGDEASVINNLDKSYLQFLRPLKYSKPHLQFFFG